MKLNLKPYFFFGAMICLLCGSCKNNTSSELGDDSVSALINIPVGPDEIIDTSSAAHLLFEKSVIDWDTLQHGEEFKAVFRFTNTGKRPAIISDVITSCGCTGTTFSTSPVLPGKTGEIGVTFNSVGRIGYQKKSINVVGNTFPSRTLLYLQGFVEK